VKWYRKAAERNDPHAQYNLGVCYAHGQGVEKDEVEAVKWYRKAAEGNYVEGQNTLGFCYWAGQGVVQNYLEAVNWYRKAAERNHAQAQYNLGVCYANGQGVAQDEVEAVKWYRKGAEGGEIRAFNYLAWILATSGNSGLRDGAAAVFCAETAVAATNRKEPDCLATLAAAYAEAGQFEKAVSTQREAIALLTTEAETKDYREQLKRYEDHKPYRAKD